MTTSDICSLRTGLRIVTRRGVHPDVQRAVLKFARWLRSHYEFPIRVPVYLSSSEQVRTSSGELRPSLFFAPYEKTDEPYISIATGDYEALVCKCGNVDDALCSILYSVALHVLNYQEWWFEHGWSERSISQRRNNLIAEYASEVRYIV